MSFHDFCTTWKPIRNIVIPSMREGHSGILIKPEESVLFWTQFRKIHSTLLKSIRIPTIVRCRFTTFAKRGKPLGIELFRPSKNDDKKALIIVFHLITSSPASGGQELGDLCTLLDWHQSDPVDAEELALNDGIEGFQGNRNLFIDEPALAMQVFGQGASE